MSSLLSTRDPDPKRDFAIEVVQRLQTAGFSALWAGGCVRDLLLGLEPQDYDVATDAHPDQVRQLFGPRKTVAVGASFGVILVLSPQQLGDVEVATFRTEGPYVDGRRPEHVSFSTAEVDAQRRDFTINGIFYDPIAGNLLDYVGGQQDLERGIIRAIGDARERFREDKLRMLRAVRIAARFDYLLDPATAEAIRAMAGEILVVSPERISQELQKMLRHARRATALELARELCLLTPILPEVGRLVDGQVHREVESDAGIQLAWSRTLKRLAALVDPGVELALAVLWYEVFPDSELPGGGVKAANEEHNVIATVQTLCRRLRLSNKESDHVGWLLANRHALRQAERLPMARLKRLLAHPLIRDLLALQRVAALAGDGEMAAMEFCERMLRELPPEDLPPAPCITGDDLIRSGLKPGARFKEFLEAVYDAQLAGEVRTKEEALKWISRLHHRHTGDSKD